MLYPLYRRNPGLNYQGGQRPIVHLVADLRQVVDFAESQGQKWAFSKGNAGAKYASFFNDLKKLAEIDWEAIDARDWTDSIVKDRKQAEFLIHGSFPWTLVERIGVIDETRAGEVQSALEASTHKPQIVVQPSWYY